MCVCVCVCVCVRERRWLLTFFASISKASQMLMDNITTLKCDWIRGEAKECVCMSVSVCVRVCA